METNPEEVLTKLKKNLEKKDEHKQFFNFSVNFEYFKLYLLIYGGLL